MNKAKKKAVCGSSVRPVIRERHDISASLYKNKNESEPCFYVKTKGENAIDLLRFGVVTCGALAAMTALKLAKVVKKQQKIKLKKLKAKIKLEKQAINKAKREL